MQVVYEHRGLWCSISAQPPAIGTCSCGPSGFQLPEVAGDVQKVMELSFYIPYRPKTEVGHLLLCHLSEDSSAPSSAHLQAGLFVSIAELQEFFLYSRRQTFIACLMCMYFSPLCGSSSLLHGILTCTDFLLMKSSVFPCTYLCAYA